MPGVPTSNPPNTHCWVIARLTLAKQTLVDFDDDSWSADGDRVGEEVFRTNVPAEVFPVHGRVTPERHLVEQCRERGVLVRHHRQRPVAVLEESLHQRLRATAPDASAMPMQKADLPTIVALSTCSIYYQKFPPVPISQPSCSVLPWSCRLFRLLSISSFLTGTATRLVLDAAVTTGSSLHCRRRGEYSFFEQRVSAQRRVSRLSPHGVSRLSPHGVSRLSPHRVSRLPT